MAVFASRQIVLPQIVNFVNYIQSNGTQFIDTLFKPNNNTRVVMDMQGATTTSGVYMHYGTVSGSLNFMAGKASSESWDLHAYYNTTYQNLATKTVSDFVMRTVFDQNKNAITVGGVSYTFAAASFSLSHTMYLFGVNSNGGASFLSPIKLYSCQIYDNGTLVRDFWPCYDPAGVACLYDKVEKKYYYNAGTGAFTAG